MSSALVLADAIEALIPADLNAFTDAVKLDERGQVYADALPWVVVRVEIPTVLARAMSGTRHGLSVEIKTTIAAITTDSVRVIADRLDTALEGTRPAATGWAVSPIRRTGASPMLEDPDITLVDSNRRVVYTVLEWTMTASAQ